MIYAENILLCIAIPLLIAVLFTRESTRRFIVSFLLGMGVCLLAAYITGFIGTAAGMGLSGGDTAIFISPIIEEIMKMMPPLFYLFMIEPEDRNLILVSVGIGTGFAIYENCCYILSLGAGNLSYILIRGLAVGVMHIVSILTFAMGLVLVRRFQMLSTAAIMGALALSMTFHGLYNLLVSAPGITTLIGYSLPLITAALLYIPYRRLRLTV